MNDKQTLTAEEAVRNLADEQLRLASKQKEYLRMLNDQMINTKGKLNVFRSVMGGTESFIGKATLAWVAENVRFATQLPIFHGKIDPNTKEIIYDKETINQITQRPLDYTRQKDITEYLATNPKHQFAPLLLVIYSDWLDNPRSDSWDGSGRAIKSVATFEAHDSRGSVGLLDVEGYHLYALDGQHRLLGIQGLMEIIKKGEVTFRKLRQDKSDGTPNGVQKLLDHKTLTLEDLERRGVTAGTLAKLANEEIGIQIISAIVPGEQRHEATARLRQIFQDVNTHGQKVKQYLTDDSEGFAIVATTISVDHPLFSRENRVNRKNSTVSDRSQNFTTSEALRSMAIGLLQNEFPTWVIRKKGKETPRPSEDEISSGTALMREFTDRLSNLPSIKKMMQGSKPSTLRNFTTHPTDRGEGHLLFRPVGQEAFAIAVGDLRTGAGGRPEMTMEEIFRRAAILETQGRLSGIDQPTSVFFGVLVVLLDKGRSRILPSGVNLASRLLKYLLGGGLDEHSRTELRNDFVTARTMADGRMLKLDGTSTDRREDIDLPNPV
jgi:hypothetical protein